MTNTEIVSAFIDRINAHDVAGLTSLMTQDHTFVDSISSEVHGRTDMDRAWTGYFKLFPDYHIAVTDIFENGDRVAVFGSASATYSPSGHLYPDHHWDIPSAWKAVVRDGRVALWAVYSDNYKTVRMIKGLDSEK